MIEILKKRNKAGDTITIHTTIESFTGTIDSIEENCIILETETTIEIISADSIVRFSTARIYNDDKSNVNLDSVLAISDDDVTPSVLDNEKPLSDESIHIEKVISAIRPPKLGLKIIGKIDLEKLPKSRNHSLKDEISYRTNRVARELGLSTAEIKERLKKSGIAVNVDKSNLLSQDEYTYLLQTIHGESPVDLVSKATKDSLGIKVNSLSQLAEIKEKIVIDDSNQPIPANATIKRYGHGGFGFITDNENQDFHFHFNEVRDEALLSRLSNIGVAEGTQVVCKLSSSDNKSFATNIYLPASVGEFNTKAEILLNNGEVFKASEIIELILEHYPNFSAALELKRRKLRARSNPKEQYRIAKNEIKFGNINRAKDILMNSDNLSESNIKEFAYLLQREGDIEGSIELVKRNLKKIKLSDPNSLLAYFHETKKDYNTAIEYLNLLVPKTKHELVKISKRKALAYFGIKDFNNSKKYLEEVLKHYNSDTISKKLLDGLRRMDSKEITQELEAIFNEAELASLTGGQSPFIQFSLDKCTYSGIPPTIINQEKFNSTTLRELRKLIEDAGRARPKERAGYLLTEAKLMSLIESEKENERSSVLSRFCLATSQNSIVDKTSVDTTRFFLLEAFHLATVYDTISGYVPVYLNSLIASPQEVFDSLNKPLEETVRRVLNKNSSQSQWLGIIELFLTNTQIFSKVLTLIFSNKEIKDNSIKFLNEYINKNSSSINTKVDYQSLWNEAIEQRKREKTIFNNKVLSIAETDTIESILESVVELLNSLPRWVNQLDKHRLKTVGEISTLIYEFINQNAFEDKERNYNLSLNQMLQLKQEIEKFPTELSFNSVRLILDKIILLVDSEYSNLLVTSRPDINISILGEGVLHETDNTVMAQYRISSKKGSAPISWLSLKIEDNSDISFIEEGNNLEQSLKGGEEKVIRLSVKISEKIKAEGASNIKVICSYKVRGREEINSIIENLSLRLYSENEFEKIENTFAATADSGPVMDGSMFYGRDEFIDNIAASIVDSVSKCVIIYGQKRSGKSSVLHHLKEKLNKSHNTFCISFSLGEIVEDLSALTFYYTVLSEIQDSLDDLKDEGQIVPDFIAPTLLELEVAPSIVFNNSMRDFKKSCSQIMEWENKRMILLLDEFTYIYSAIQKGVLNGQFMKTWKSLLEKGYFSSVLVGQDIMPKFTQEYPNEFGVTEPKRLSYLSKEDAKKLVEQPIWDKNLNRSRILGNAVELILDYTSSNPYYVQIFCARMVDYMNSRKIVSVTEADVIDVAQSFTRGEQSLTADKFDNLITAGDADMEANSPKDVLKALKEIARASKNLDSCHRDTISLADRKYEDTILNDLKSREVISSPSPLYYKINVRIFKEWLLVN